MPEAQIYDALFTKELVEAYNKQYGRPFPNLLGKIGAALAKHIEEYPDVLRTPVPPEFKEEYREMLRTGISDKEDL